MTAFPPSARQASLEAHGGTGLHPDQTPPSFCGTYSATLVIASPSPAAGPAGTHITLDGSGFYSAGNYGFVEVWLTTDSGASLDTVVVESNETGAPFNVTVPFPGVGTSGGLALGTYYLWALSSATPSNCADATFTLTGIDPPGLACESWAPDLRVISPAPATGITGTPVRLQGVGFNDQNATPIYWYPPNATSYTLVQNDTTGLNATTGATGEFNITVDVPTGFTAGTYFFWAAEWEYTPHLCAAAEFNLTAGGPSIALSPTSGPGATNVTVTGTGFNDSDTSISITGDVLLFPLPCTLSGGSVTGSCYFYVSGGLAGTHTITGVGNIGGDTATATFTLFPTIFLNLSRGPIGSSITISGADFSAGPSAAYVSFDGQLLSPTGGSDCAPGPPSTLITPDDLGQFECTFTVPTWATFGPNYVQGDDTFTGELTANETFTVTATLQLTITSTPLTGPANTPITVLGTGFYAGSAMEVFFDYPADDNPVTCSGGAPVVSTLGTFSCTFDVPNIGAGTYQVTAEDPTDGAVPSTNEFTLPPPRVTITSTPLTGPPGTPITVAGTGFYAGLPIEVSFGAPPGTTVVTCAAGTPLVSTLGTFSCTFDAPSYGPESVAGTYSIVAFDATDGSVQSTNEFTIGILPPQVTITSTPLTGPPGTPITVAGTGFYAGLPIEVSFGAPPGTTVVTCAAGTPLVSTLGTFSCTFDAPSNGPESVPGTYSIVAFDATDGSVSSANSFTLTTPSVVTVTSTTGTPRVVTFTVGGLGPDVSYYVYLDTAPGALSATSYNPLGTCTASASGVITDCQVTLPSELAPGRYYVDLYQDPEPPPYIFSVYNFTVPASSSGASHPLLSTLDYEIIAGVIVVAAIGVVVIASRRRSGGSSPPSANPPTSEQKPAEPGD